MQNYLWWSCLCLTTIGFLGCGPQGPLAGLEADGSQTQPLELENLFPGRGYDLVADTAKGFCLEPAAAAPVDETGGQEVVFSLQVIEDSKSLAREMQVSAAASLKFGFAGGEAKAKFVEESELSQTSVYALVAVRVLNPHRVVREIEFRQAAIGTLMRDPVRFRELCGDGYVSSIRTGGEYFGLLEVSTSTEKERQELTASISASGMTWSAEASFHNAVNNSVAHKRIKLRTIQLGGSGIEAAPCTDVRCLLARAHDMAENIRKSPVLVSAQVMPYSTVPRPDDVRQPIDTQVMQLVQSDLVKTRLDLRDHRARYAYALNHPHEFLGLDVHETQSAMRTCEVGINVINRSAIACYRDYNLCEMPEVIFPSAAWPVRKGPCDVAIALCLEGNINDIDVWQEQCIATGAAPINLMNCAQASGIF